MMICGVTDDTLFEVSWICVVWVALLLLMDMRVMSILWLRSSLLLLTRCDVGRVLMLLQSSVDTRVV
jgi:hypothetical protein